MSDLKKKKTEQNEVGWRGRQEQELAGLLAMKRTSHFTSKCSETQMKVA